jgi:hypothetical protein
MDFRESNKLFDPFIPLGGMRVPAETQCVELSDSLLA